MWMRKTLICIIYRRRCTLRVPQSTKNIHSCFAIRIHIFYLWLQSIIFWARFCSSAMVHIGQKLNDPQMRTDNFTSRKLFWKWVWIAFYKTQVNYRYLCIVTYSCGNLHEYVTMHKYIYTPWVRVATTSKPGVPTLFRLASHFQNDHVNSRNMNCLLRVTPHFL